MSWFGTFLDWVVGIFAVFITGWGAGWLMGAIFAILISFKEYIRNKFDI